MLPAVRGRHCEQCCKTVVDFTGMSDGEVLNYFKSRAGGGDAAGGVCGRFAGDQLGRELSPAPVQRNGVKGWPWVVAGAMMVSQGPDGGGLRKAGVEVRQGGSGVYSPVIGKPKMQADTATPVLTGTVSAVCDTSSVDMGAPVVTIGEVVENKVWVDTIRELPADTVYGWAMQTKHLGAVKIVWDSTIDIKAAIDTVVSAVKDTVAAVVQGFHPGPIVRIFPNPVVRGGMMRLEWGGGGRYQVALVSAGGALVQERMVETAGKGQIDEWMLPNGLAAGIYFLRVARPGEKLYTVEVLVQ